MAADSSDERLPGADDGATETPSTAPMPERRMERRAQARTDASVPGDGWLRRKWWMPVVIALTPVLVILVALVWFTGGGDDTSIAGTTIPEGTTTAGADFAEVPTFDLAKVGGAKFASLTMQQGDTVQSYMFASGQPGFTALTEAVAAAKPVDGAVGDTGTTLTFVTQDKGTVTLTLDLAANRFAYGGTAWLPSGDLTGSSRRRWQDSRP